MAAQPVELRNKRLRSLLDTSERELVVELCVSLLNGLEGHISDPLAGRNPDEMFKQPCLGLHRYCLEVRLHRLIGTASLVVLLVLVIAHPPHSFLDQKFHPFQV